MKNNTIKQHEELLIDTFVIKEQKQRIKSLIKNKKGRKKFREMLSHSIKFNSNLIQKIPNDKQTSLEILKILSRYKADKFCYLISENSELDGQIMKLEDAVNNIIGSGISTIISCIPGKLAYYEGEGFNNRLILKSI